MKTQILICMISLMSLSVFAKDTFDKSYPNDHKTKSEILVRVSDGNLLIYNNSTQSVKLQLVNESNIEDVSKLNPGELRFINAQELNKGIYSVFVSGKYEEVLKMYSWS
ncbi:MAG: hypothetical protein MRY83_17085, partial [Flavobacteriales bacterium]|nr:hypothetical protein [Flavobacteriales bacterium]